MQSEFRHTTHYEFRERAKFESRHPDVDEEHFSEPSTMHSLGNLEEHSSPTRDTPKSSKVRQLGHQTKHEAKDQIGSIKAMLSRVFGEKVDTARDNDEKTKQILKNVNQEILQRPKRNERVIESEGKGSGKMINSHSFGRISEIRDKVARYMPEVKESAHLFISVARNHLGEIKDNFLSNFNWAESVSPSSDLRPEIKEQLNRINEDIRKLPRRGERVIESSGRMQSSPVESQFQNKKPEEKDLWDLAFHKIEELKEKAHQKGQEKKQEYERTPEQTQGGPEHQYFHPLHHEHHHLSAQSASFQSTERGRELEQQYLNPLHHEHHHLSAQSASFQPTEHGRELFESVKDGLTDDSVPLTKKVEEVESHWKQEECHGQSQQQKPQIKESEKPSSKSLKQGAQELKSKITEKVDDIKQSLQPGQPKEREPLLDKIINRIQGVSDNIYQILEYLKDSFKVEEAPHNYEPLLDKISHGIENARQRLHPQERQQQIGEEGHQEKSGEIQAEKLTKGIQLEEGSDEKDIAAMLIRNLESRKGNQQDEKSDEKDIAAMLIRNLKSHVIQLGKSDEEDIASMLTHNLHLRKNRLGDSIHHISDNIHHRVENIRGRLGFGNERTLEQILSQKLSHLNRQGRNLKNHIAQKEEEDDLSEDFHRVGTGFYKTIHEYNHERRLRPLKSRNPFQALQADDDEAEEPEDLKEVLPDQPPFDLSISQSLHSLPHRIKESLAHKLDGMRSKLGWEHKHPGEKVHHLVPEEIQGGDEEEEDYEVENFEDEDEPAKGRLRRSLKKISYKISALKKQIRSKKNELLEILNNQEPLEADEEVVEESQPISQNIQNIETLKQAAAVAQENYRSELQQIKHRKKKTMTPKSASKVLEKKPQIPSFEGLQPYVKKGFWQTVKEFERELRGPPLVSSNPFAGLMAENMPRRKVSFQEPQQQKKKLFRLSKSAGKEAKRKRFEDFHAIKSGFSKSVAHYQRELRGEPLISDNPFEPLNKRNVNLAQPLQHNLVVGGHLDELIVGVTNKKFDFGTESTQKKSQGSAKKVKKIPGADITNKIVGESQVKALIKKSKGEAYEISSKISGKLHGVKDKIKTAFHREDKENAAHVE